MTVRNFVEKTRNDYIRQVRAFTAFLGRSPDQAIPEDFRRFQLHQTQTGVRPPSINGSVAALRFFFTVTLDRPEMARHLTFVREPRKMRSVLSPEEVARLLEAASGPKYKVALSAAYAAGLQVSEVVSLKVSDIDSERMLRAIGYVPPQLQRSVAIVEASELLPLRLVSHDERGSGSSWTGEQYDDLHFARALHSGSDSRNDHKAGRSF